MNDDVSYQLRRRRNELLALCQQWKLSVQVIPSNDPCATWGPSLVEMLSSSESVDDRMCCVDSDEEIIESDIDDAASGEDDLLESIAFNDIYDYNDVVW